MTAAGLLHPWGVQAGWEGSVLAWDVSGREGCWVCWRLLDGRVVVQGEPGHPAAPEQGGGGVS